MSQLPALRDVLDETAPFNGLAPRNNGFTSNPAAACAATTTCGRRSTICWQRG